jgi:hypothetical protein
MNLFDRVEVEVVEVVEVVSYSPASAFLYSLRLEKIQS